jgi:hypothetical protein
MPGERRRRAPAALVLVTLLFVMVAGSIAYALAGRIPACALVPAEQCTRVLFIGNSYTSVNDLPGTFARLAASGGHHVETAMIAPGGAFLSDELANPDVGAAIAATRWTAVVLQEQSERPANPSEVASAFVPAVSELATMAVRDGARPLLLETWAHRDGWSDLGLDYTAMQAAIDQAYAKASRQTGSAVIPVGEAWQRALAAGLPTPLWQADGSHPSAAGTYLAACMAYETVFGQSPVGLGDHEGLPDDVAGQLQRIASGG